MKTWQGQTADCEFAVELQGSVLKALDQYCSDAGSLETGGILIGYYTNGSLLAIIREATPPPPDSKRGRSQFERGVTGLRKLLGKRWLAKERTFYLGEWHFHPASCVEPSSQDFAQMIEISQARRYDCKEPLLLILGNKSLTGKRPLRIFICLATGNVVEFNRSTDLSSSRASYDRKSESNL